MISPAPENSDELLEGIFQDIPEPGAEPLVREFRPWHKPRKHYIRIKQWCYQTQRLIGRLGLQPGESLRYLGFPGEDFLDIRSMQGVCDRAQIKLRYLGFDRTASSAPGENVFALQSHAVFSLGFIDGLSLVVKDDLERVANARSVAYKRSYDCGHFDILNLDLCNSVAATPAAGNDSCLAALARLFELQIQNRIKPWLLFLTTRAGREHLDDEVKRKLFSCLLKNVRRHAGFAAGLQSSFGMDGSVIQAEIDGEETLEHLALIRAFGLSFGKWLLHQMATAVPPVSVDLLPSYSYRVEIDEPDMLSLAFLFTPVPQPASDAAGLSPPAVRRSPPPQELEAANRILAAMQALQDLDEMLDADDNLRRKMTEKSADLLESAAYSREDYLKWVADAE